MTAVAPHPQATAGVTTPTLNAIDIANLCKQYDGTSVLSDVSFSVAPGTVCGLTGPNGAGKSTLLRILLGLATADSGTAFVHGTTYQQSRQPTRLVGTVLDGTGVAPRDSALTHLRRVARYLSLPSSRVDEVLDQVGLTEAASRRSGGYSLGMGQRLALANAMLAHPQVLILDEPTNGLDPDGMRWLRELLQSFTATGGTVMISTHQLMDLQQVVDQVVILEQSVVFDGTLGDLGVDEAQAGALEASFLARTGAAR